MRFALTSSLTMPNRQPPAVASRPAVGRGPRPRSGSRIEVGLPTSVALHRAGKSDQGLGMPATTGLRHAGAGPFRSDREVATQILQRAVNGYPSGKPPECRRGVTPARSEPSRRWLVSRPDCYIGARQTSVATGLPGR